MMTTAAASASALASASATTKSTTTNKTTRNMNMTRDRSATTISQLLLRLCFMTVVFVSSSSSSFTVAFVIPITSKKTISTTTTTTTTTTTFKRPTKPNLFSYQTFLSLSSSSSPSPSNNPQENQEEINNKNITTTNDNTKSEENISTFNIQNDNKAQQQQQQSSSSSSSSSFFSNLSDDEKKFVKESLLQNILFTKLSESSLNALVEQFEKVQYNQPGTIIVQQGEDVYNNNYYVYMVGEHCECTVTVDGNIVPEPFGTLSSRSIFGDLAVLYNETRAATISTKQKKPKQKQKKKSSSLDDGIEDSDDIVTLYRVDGDIYKNIVLYDNVDILKQQEQGEGEGGTTLDNKNGRVTAWDFSTSSSSSFSTRAKIPTSTSTTSTSTTTAPSLLEEMQQIDEVINQISGSTTLYSGNVIPKYKPERLWLWRRWSGTILRVSYQITLLNMFVCWLFTIYAHPHAIATVAHHDELLTATATATASSTIMMNDNSWINNNNMNNNNMLEQILQNGLFFLRFDELTIPDKSLPFVQRLSLLHDIWGYQQGLTTFILTFFLNQAFQFWKKVYFLARDVQGRLNDYQFVLVACAKRNLEDGTFTKESIELLDDIGRYSRIFHALFWAAIARRFAPLATPAGLERMASRGLITTTELHVLQNDLNIPGNRFEGAILQWMIIRANQAMQKGIIDNDNATKAQLLQQITKLRAAYVAIEDELDGRMPLAYVNFVQILVDTFVVIAPFALYADLGNYSIFAVGILTLFYTGLLNLAKIFLDPLNNENFCENAIFMDLGIFIRESNRNSIRWKNAGSKVPF